MNGASASSRKPPSGGRSFLEQGRAILRPAGYLIESGLGQRAQKDKVNITVSGPWSVFPNQMFFNIVPRWQQLARGPLKSCT